MTDTDTVWQRGIPEVGREAELTPKVLKQDIELFTAIAGDLNPLPNDGELAGKTKFGGIIVQGGVTGTILNAVVAEKLPGPGTVVLHVNWHFKAPVRPGDTITGTVEVIEVRTDKPLTKLRTTVTNHEGTIVLDGEALCYTMPSSPDPAR